MRIEFGDMSDVGEAWVRYQGNRVISDFAEVMGSAVRADVTGALRRTPKLIEFYDIDPADLEDGYLAGGCWVFRVCAE